jgi:hypothetical protein
MLSFNELYSKALWLLECFITVRLGTEIVDSVAISRISFTSAFLFAIPTKECVAELTG